MIIVTQNQAVIVNLKNVFTIEIELFNNKFGIFIRSKNISDACVIAGKYDTEDRVKEVLQEIVYAYTTNIKCYYMPAEAE